MAKEKKKAEAPNRRGAEVPTPPEADELHVEEEEDQGADLCPKCGNLMIEEDGKKVCSHCIDNIDFFGEEENLEDFLSKEDHKDK